MSRTYSTKTQKCRDVYIHGNSFRVRNHQCLQKEVKNADYGDVVFPEYRSYCHSSGSYYYDIKNEIRKKYFLEIRNILNGYSCQGRYTFENDHNETFIAACNKIKGFIPDDGRKYDYEWLNVKKIKNVIKTWAGNPLDVLKYLADIGLIEEAVRIHTKLETKK